MPTARRAKSSIPLARRGAKGQGGDKRERTRAVVTLTGSDLTLDDVVRVARDDARVALDRGAVARMRAARAVVERSLSRGETVYGMNTGVAARKRVRVSPAEIEAYNHLLIQNHRVGQGPLSSREGVRAALLRIANGFARGTTPVRPALAEHLVGVLNQGLTPPVRTLGSVGASDLAPNADLAAGVLGDFRLAAGEALALMNNNGFATGQAALAVADAGRLLGALEVAGALDLEAFAANLTLLHPAVAEARPYPGLGRSALRLRQLLEGSYLWENGAARNLQDPLTFRGMPQVLGAARDTFAFVSRQLVIELNAAHDNPLVIPGEDRIISVWNGEIAPLAAALDFLRISLAPVLTSANERMLKLLQAPLSGLPDGLAARAGLHEDALAEFGVAGQALCAEARLLAQPVSFELASTTQAEGIEDRTTLAPLSARRLRDMVELGERIAAIELVVAAQAIDLRGRPKLGRGTAVAYRKIRDLVAATGAGEPCPQDLEPLCALIRSGALSPAIEIIAPIEEDKTP
jgi:histidine ammonia-lyase